jgi:hypothetical protein
MSQDTIIHELRAIVGENYRRRAAADLGIPADAKE